MEVKIEGKSKSTKFLAALMPSIVEQCGLHKSKAAVLVKVTNDFLEDADGMAMYVDIADCYVILLQPPKRITASALNHMAVLLSHEMVHVRQRALGILKYSKNQSPIWKGKQYKKNTPYLDMPWEIDAFSKQEIIARRAMKAIGV